MTNATLPKPKSHAAPAQRKLPEDVKPSFAELLGVLNYNQGLVEFADSKAGSLILLNSLLIAAVGALPSDGQIGSLKMVSIVICSVAVYLCFQVISSRGSGSVDTMDESGPFFVKKPNLSTGWESDDFIFFDCVMGHQNGDDYTRAFGRSDADSRRRALLQRTYIIAGIAKRKFGQYRVAQKATSIALGGWVIVNLLPFLAQ